MNTSLINISDINQENIFLLLGLAEKISNGYLPQLTKNAVVASLFFENSTRTRVSFELAAKKLVLTFINVDVENSSTNKGESPIDTFKSLAAMNIDIFIVRSKEEKLITNLQTLLPTISFINAGAGARSHPSQALLDLFTIKQKFNSFKDLKVTICGDIRHSRVASSLISALTIVGVKDIKLTAPDYFLPEQPIVNTIVEQDLDKACNTSDLIYTLRVQSERISQSIPIDQYIKNYSITQTRLNNLSKNPFIMHPGPINRGIEISSEVADGHSSLILKQVENGVYARMAILAWTLGELLN